MGRCGIVLFQVCSIPYLSTQEKAAWENGDGLACGSART